MVCLTMKARKSRRNKSKLSDHVKTYLFFLIVYILVSLMRNETNVEVKYSDDIQSEESKEEEVKQTQIARVVEKNGTKYLF